jgi:hypothetical protein
VSAGWGGGSWGLSPWGTGGPSLVLVDARPRRENVVRLFFNVAPYFSGLLDPFDASSRFRYGIVPVDGTIGADGLPPRPVLPAVPAVALVPGSAGSVIDLTLDRRMSPYPARYLVSVNGMRTVAGATLQPGGTSRKCDGLSAARVVQDRTLVAAGRDVANPQSLLSAGDNVPVGAGVVLGTYQTSSSGDYATDRGLASYRKRIVRRLSAMLGGFAHLPGYGLGALDKVKLLDRGGSAEALASEAEAQVKEEPETQSARVTVERSAADPGVVVLRVRAVTRTGAPVDMGIPFPAGGG